jgi:hypothetical protein
MKRNNEVTAELIPSPSTMLRTGVNEAELNKLVQLKVAEIMAERDAVVFEPFFRSRKIAYELKRLQTVPEQRKWTVWFERYGCLLCETRARIHVGNGMCTRCYPSVFNALTQIIAEQMSGETATASTRAIVTGHQVEDGPTTRTGLLPMKVHRRWNKRRTRKANENGGSK